MKIRKEGFWYSKYEPHFPKPEQMGVWANKENANRFCTLLKRVEKKARCKGYKGSSICRICKKKNGSTTFFYKNWVWPEGLIHYIKEHNVVPSKTFMQFIRMHSRLN